MAEALERIKKDDIEKFIVILMYGDSPQAWPGVTIMLSSVTIHHNKSSIEEFEWIHRNTYQTHAEIHFLEYLKNRLKDGEEVKIKKIEAILVQNYSPCHNCAHEILQFKKDKEKDITFSLTVKFANFYRDYESQNMEGLKKLLRDDIKLALLQGEDEWKDFLGDTTFVLINTSEYNELLERATSCKRVTREKVDKGMLDDIESNAQSK